MRGQGIGGRLVEEAIEWARKSGFRKISLYADSTDGEEQQLLDILKKL